MIQIVPSNNSSHSWRSFSSLLILLILFPAPLFALYTINTRTTCLQNSWLDICEIVAIKINIRPITLVGISLLFFTIGLILFWKRSKKGDSDFSIGPPTIMR